MDRQQAFAALNVLESMFLGSLVHPDGEPMTRQHFRNVDAVIIEKAGIVFRNKDGKHLVVLHDYQRRTFPTRHEVASSFVPRIIDELIARSTHTDDEKLILKDSVELWLSSRTLNPENARKIQQYNDLKKELEEKGLI